MTRSWLAALLLLTTSGTAASAQELQWQPVPPLPALQENNAANTVVAKPLLWEPVPAATESPTSTLTSTTPPPPPTALVWKPVTPSNNAPSDSTPSSTSIAVMPEANPTISANAGLVWEPVDSEGVIVAEEVTTPPPGANSAEQAIATARAAIEQKAATFANDRALWRNERWYPQISSDVPVGFGPTGVMTSFGLFGYDCNNVGGVCEAPTSWADYQNQLERFGEAEYNLAVGLGDTEKLFGLTITSKFEETGIPIGTRNENSTRNLFSNYYIGLDLSRSLGPDTAIRIGVRNWLDVREQETSFIAPKSAFGVISQRIRLKDDQDNWFPNAYLTAGIGNGDFRSVDQKFQASVAAQRSAGCYTYGYYDGNNCTIRQRLLANNRSVSYGEIVPIGSVAVEVYPGFNLISEWSRGNLNAGFSLRPFKDLGIIFTSMWGSLIQNCDWGCKVSIPDVPGGVELEPSLITERVKWSFNISFSVKL